MAVKYVVLGGTSALVQSTLKQIEEPSSMVLIGRHESRLNQVKDDLCARGHIVHVICCDVGWQKITAENIWKQAVEILGGVDVVLVGQGYLSQTASYDLQEIQKTFDVNFHHIVCFLEAAKQSLKSQKNGHIVVITSVAGIRGRATQYVYGSAKAAMIHWLEGLRMELFSYGVTVTDIRPGPVWTPMTQHLEKGLLFADDEDVGLQILRAIKKGSDVVYTPSWWKWVMMVIRWFPRFFYKRLSF